MTRKPRRVRFMGEPVTSMRLTDEEVAGLACVFCGLSDAPLIPVGFVGAEQVLGHEVCRDNHISHRGDAA